jgi:ureidoglycolate lyase
MADAGAAHRPPEIVALPVQPLNAAAFAPFGQIIAPAPDGVPFGPADAQLELNRGIPRFYMMTLRGRDPVVFNVITRHLRVTQCLASVGRKSWLIAVAPPNDPDDPRETPDPAAIRTFLVPGTLAIKLHRSTWHAGPFFKEATLDFLNLELSDTNSTDHFSCDLERTFGLQFRIVDGR